MVIRGRIDEGYRPTVDVPFRLTGSAESVSFACWVDTGFNGHVVLRPQHRERLNIEPKGLVDAVLADGSIVQIPCYSSEIFWMGTWTEIEVLLSDHGEMPLLGLGLIVDYRLEIDYPTGEVLICPSQIHNRTTST